VGAINNPLKDKTDDDVKGNQRNITKSEPGESGEDEEENSSPTPTNPTPD